MSKTLLIDCIEAYLELASLVFIMDIATLQAFEDRAAAAEERLADLETKLTNGTYTFKPAEQER